MGKKQIFFYSTIFILFLYSFSAYSQKLDKCPYSLDKAMLAGNKFVAQASGGREAFCVKASSDAEAIKECGSGYVPRNPGNPQYGVEDRNIVYDLSDDPTSNSRSSNDKNLFGFYFCVPNIPENQKKYLCNNFAQGDAALNRSDIYMYMWPKTKAGEDADCLFKLKTEPESAWRPYNLSEIADRTRSEKTVLDQVNVINNSFSAAKSTLNSNVTGFNSCVDDLYAYASTCKSQGELTKSDCNPNNLNRQSTGGANSLSANNILGGLSSAYIQSKVASGAQSTCFTAGLAANAGRLMTDDANSSCKGGNQICSSVCSEDAFNTKKSSCAQMIGVTSEQLDSQVGATPANAAQFSYYSSKILNGENGSAQALLNSGIQNCEAAKQTASDVEKIAQGMANSTQQAMTCACQLSGTSGSTTSSIGGCSNIPNPAACEANPSIAGCELYSQMSVCTPGASYNAELCRCQTNPKASGCAGAKTDTLLSSFAGGSIKAGAVAGPSGFGMPAGFQSSGNAGDLGTGADPSDAGLVSSGKATGLGNVLPSVTSGSGGGGSGGPAGGGSDKATASASPDEGNSIVKGILSAGRFIGNALGIKQKPSSGGVLAEKKNAKARNGVRGLANQKTFASKHVTIWELMNKCVQGVTCESNIGQFISEP